MENITNAVITSDVLSMEEGTGTASLTSKEDWPTEEECSSLANLPPLETRPDEDTITSTSTVSDPLSQSKSVVLPHTAFDNLNRRFGATSHFTRTCHTFSRHPNHLHHGERMSLSGMLYAKKVLPIVKEHSQELSQEKISLDNSSSNDSSHNHGRRDELEEFFGCSPANTSSADDIALAVQRGSGMAISADFSTVQPDIHCEGGSTLTSSDNLSSSNQQQQKRGKLGGSNRQSMSPPPSEQSPPKLPPKNPLWFFILVGLLVILILVSVISAMVCGLVACNSKSRNPALDEDSSSSLPQISLPTLAQLVPSVDATFPPSSWSPSVVTTRLPTHMPSYTATLISSSAAAPPTGTQNRTATRRPWDSSPPVPFPRRPNTTRLPVNNPSPKIPTKSPNRHKWPTWTNMPAAKPPG
jgi:hypothetical protein